VPEQIAIDSQLLQRISQRFNGEVPDNLDDLLSLLGVGRNTANILLGNTFGQQTIGLTLMLCVFRKG
jgi:endonuclease III